MTAARSRSTNKPAGRVAERHVPLRRCVVCRDSKPQADLLRLYRDASAMWQFDLRRKAGGRGAWLCKDKPSCHSPKALKRYFRNDAERVATDLNTIIAALSAATPPEKHSSQPVKGG